MQNEALTKEALTSRLKEAEKAHAEYEYALGRRDDDWAMWYAGFIINRLQEDSDMAIRVPKVAGSGSSVNVGYCEQEDSSAIEEGHIAPSAE